MLDYDLIATAIRGIVADYHQRGHYAEHEGALTVGFAIAKAMQADDPAFDYHRFVQDAGLQYQNEPL